MKSERDDDLLQKQITRIELSERLDFIREMLRVLCDRVLCTNADRLHGCNTLELIVDEMTDARVSLLVCTEILKKRYIDKKIRHSLAELGFGEIVNNPTTRKQIAEEKRRRNGPIEKSGGKISDVPVPTPRM